MKIIITESQYNLLFENKGVDAAQTLIDMAVDDYIESCGKMKAFTNIQLAICKGLKNGTVKLEVTKVSDFNIGDQKNFRIHLNLFVNQEWMFRNNSYYESFENTLAIKIGNILGVMRYFCYIDDIKMIDNKDNLTEEQLKKLQESDDDLQKTKALVLSMHDEGMDINDIEKYTNLPLQALIFLLKDHVKVDINDTQMLHDYLWDYVLPSDIFDRKKVFEDGTKLEVFADYMSLSLQFTYIANHEHIREVIGYATFVWDGTKVFPIDIQEVVFHDDEYEMVEKYLGNFTETFNEPEFRRIKTLSDYIDFLNERYFLYIKDEVDEYLIMHFD